LTFVSIIKPSSHRLLESSRPILASGREPRVVHRSHPHASDPERESPGRVGWLWPPAARLPMQTRANDADLRTVFAFARPRRDRRPHCRGWRGRPLRTAQGPIGKAATVHAGGPRKPAERRREVPIGSRKPAERRREVPIEGCHSHKGRLLGGRRATTLPTGSSSGGLPAEGIMASAPS
jgi:hypothetical protein